jgi:ribonuclease HI
MHIELLFDGGNGASLDKEAYGSYRIITSAGDNRITRVSFGTGYTNNDAEYMTLIAGLNHILMACEVKGIAPFDVELSIKGDSMLVKEQIGTYTYRDVGELLTGDITARMYLWNGWKVNVKRLEPLRDEARKLLEKFYTFDYQHIPRKEVVKVLGH